MIFGCSGGISYKENIAIFIYSERDLSLPLNVEYFIIKMTKSHIFALHGDCKLQYSVLSQKLSHYTAIVFFFFAQNLYILLQLQTTFCMPVQLSETVRVFFFEFLINSVTDA